MVIIEGSTHLVPTKKPDRAFTIFGGLYTADRDGIIVSRTAPDLLRQRFRVPTEVRCFWITTTQVESEYAVRPRLEHIRRIVTDFRRAHPEGIILLDGIEFLIQTHGFDETLSFLWIVRDEVALSKCRCLIPVDLDSLSKSERVLLERELEPI
jgi:hypothetical protein